MNLRLAYSVIIVSLFLICCVIVCRVFPSAQQNGHSMSAVETAEPTNPAREQNPKAKNMGTRPQGHGDTPQMKQ